MNQKLWSHGGKGRENCSVSIKLSVPKLTFRQIYKKDSIYEVLKERSALEPISCMHIKTLGNKNKILQDN